ncbi:ribose-phosphate pyrophosphokinase [Candidatus Daviesbacteria bacterium]|nr:ribose-phosphate pyrophosphokinase [Candidatus Daviesbacteria bacterium]
MYLFTFLEYLELAQKLSGFKKGGFKVKRFPNQEIFITLEADVKDQDCFILGSITPPDEVLLASLMLAHTLKKEGAKQITFIAPYLAYTRQDKPKDKESMAADLVGQMFKASGVTKVITVDIHSEQVAKLFPIELISLSPASIFAEELKKLDLKDSFLVAPDQGTLKLMTEVNGLLPDKLPVAHFEKQRTHSGVSHLAFHGEVAKRAIVIDDMLDTGGTLVSACKTLYQKGVKEMIILVTHGLFTGNKWQELWSLGVKTIYCTDTLPLSLSLNKDKIKVLSIAEILQKALI